MNSNYIFIECYIRKNKCTTLPQEKLYNLINSYFNSTDMVAY
jgi:hypothetical protein